MRLHLQACVAVLAFTTSITASPTPKQESYFIVFQSATGGNGPSQDQSTFRNAIQSLSIPLKERYTYTTLVNGISATFDPKHLDALRAIPTVKNIYPLMVNNKRQQVTQETSDERLSYVHGITGVKEVRDTHKLSGKGIKVGIIDTGIDYTHPALGGCFGKGCKVEFGYDFVGDDYTGENEPVPDPDPMGCIGHGTHVAGIVAASSAEITGVAPNVRLGAYKVGGCTGRTQTDVLVKALERAYEDGMDVINLSIGFKASWARYPISLAAQALTEKGVVVVASAGNDGNMGLFYTSAPALAPDVISVASFDSLRYLANGFLVDGEKDVYDYSMGFEYRPTHQKAELVSAGNGVDDFLCTPNSTLDMKDKIVLVQRGGKCGFFDKSANAKQGGAVAVLLYNSEPGLLKPMYLGPFQPVEPYNIGISQDTGNRLLARLGKGKVTLSFPSEPFVFDNPSGGHVSTFSSWGPDPELASKPDIGAPGGLIFSTYPMKKGGYTTMSGTSMAAPYISGVVALLLEAKGKKMTPKQVKALLQNTAIPTKEDASDAMHPTIHQGAGLVNIKNALSAYIAVSPSRIELLSTDILTHKLAAITIRNTGRYAGKYRIRHLPAKSVLFHNHTDGSLARPPYTLSDKFASFDMDSKPFEMEAGHERSLNLFFKPPHGLDAQDRWIYSGYVVIENVLSYSMIKAGQVKYPPVYVPYVGMNGPYKSFNPIAGQSVSDTSTGEVITANQLTTFNLKDASPAVSISLRLPVKHIVVSVVDAESKAVLGSVPKTDQNYVSLVDTDTSFFSNIPWDGRIVGKDSTITTVPDGKKLQLRVSVLMPFGQDSTVKDWTTWDSPAFVLDRTTTAPQTAEPLPTIPDKIEQPISLNALVPNSGKLFPAPASVDN